MPTFLEGFKVVEGLYVIDLLADKELKNEFLIEIKTTNFKFIMIVEIEHKGGSFHIKLRFLFLSRLSFIIMLFS